MSDRDVERVAAGYDIVYAAIPKSATFARIWREHAMGADFPDGFEHISFVTRAEIESMRDALALPAGGALVDLACGMGGPGLWIARESGARLTGVDISSAALAGARDRAARVDLTKYAMFVEGTFAATGLDPASADGVMTVDALQYAPDKRAAFAEVARILRPGGRFVFACFVLDPERVAGVPILGADPVPDYGPLLEGAGLRVLRYDETPGWRERLTAAYSAVIAARDALVPEIGEPAYNALIGEMSLTLQLHPYRARVFAVCDRR